MIKIFILIGDQLSKKDYKDVISNFFFAEPNMIYSELMYQLRDWMIAYYSRIRPENSYDRSRIDIEKNIKMLYYIIVFLIMIKYMKLKMINLKYVNLIELWMDIPNFMMDY